MKEELTIELAKKTCIEVYERVRRTRSQKVVFEELKKILYLKDLGETKFRKMIQDDALSKDFHKVAKIIKKYILDTEKYPEFNKKWKEYLESDERKEYKLKLNV